jgi:hypothetical protein
LLETLIVGVEIKFPLSYHQRIRLASVNVMNIQDIKVTIYYELNTDDGDIYVIPVQILNNLIYQKGICVVEVKVIFKR